MFQRLLESSYLARYILFNSVGVDDYRIFPSRVIANQAPAFHFDPPVSADDIAPVLDGALHDQVGLHAAGSLDQYLQRNGTQAFLVIQHDRILCERYYGGSSHDSICTSFSVAKSFVSAMVGLALHEKLIGSLDDPLIRYIPELKGPAWPAITIRHLVSMSSGIAYSQAGFLPWNDQPRIYYSLDLRRVALQARPVETPGRRFLYNNYNLVLIGMLLERVTGGHVADYLSEKIWKLLGMEAPATWSMDSQRCGMEKMESGINARAIDFAKFGRLYLRRGDWNGRQVIPEEWVIESTTPWPDGRWSNFKYFWWLPRSGKGRFMTVGNLGQFIYVAPDKDCILVRFGRGKPANWQASYPALWGSIVNAL